MKKLLLTIILLLTLLIASQQITIAPCKNPIRYKIERIDSKFNVSREKFSAQVDKAAKIWNKAYGQDLFVADPGGSLSINLIYDERQGLSAQIVTTEDELGKEQTSLEQKIAKYRQDVETFEAKVEALNKQIEEWNQKGGAPEDVYNQLRQEQTNLREEAAELDQRAKTLKITSTSFNKQVGQLNENINTFNASLEQRPEEGIYLPGADRIEIYFNINESEAIHTLAHEMGHAIRLEHNDNKKSIMYSQTTKSVEPSSEDLNSLKTRCKPYTLFERIKTNFDYYLRNLSVSGVGI